MKRIFFLSIALLSLISCTKERELRKVSSDPLRHPKKAFQGEFTYLKSVISVDSPGKKHHWIPQGLYLNKESLVRFEIHETELLVIDLYPEVQETLPAVKSRVLAKFPIRNIDILRKQNAFGEETQEEEVTETRRDAGQREFIAFQSQGPEWDPIDPFVSETKYFSPAQAVRIDPLDGSIHFHIERRLKDDTLLTIAYSFAKNLPSNYPPKHYSQETEEHFGYFKTIPLTFDSYSRVTTTEAKRQQLINRRNPKIKTTYYFSQQFPNYLKESVKKAFDEWNKNFIHTVGKPLLELKENSGQLLGDVRYNLVVYDPTPYSIHGILGYGPTLAHPLSGEILKGDVILFGGTIKRAVFNDRLWQTKLKTDSIAKQFAISSVKRLDTSNYSSLKNNIRKIRTRNAAPQLSTEPWQEFQQPMKLWSSRDLMGFSKKYHPQAATALLKNEILKPFSQCSTRITDPVLQNIQTLSRQDGVDDETLEQIIFAPLVLHEIGHNLGLRHNFKASADIRNGKSSSVMDYAFLNSEDLTETGVYDQWAIKVGYGAADETKKGIEQNLLYCTDHQLYQSLDPLCSLHDKGASLSDLVQNYHKRYYASFIFNNLRLDRFQFSRETDEDYIPRVLTLLLPLRLIHDHADAIIRAYEAKDMVSLWRLLRTRIEANEASNRDEVLSIKLKAAERLKIENGAFFHGFHDHERFLDKKKIATAFQDAKKARTQAFTSLASILFENQRSNSDTFDQINHELMIRGVLTDKLLALLLIAVPLEDPLIPNSQLSPFSTSDRETATEFFLTLISDFMPLDSAGLKPEDLDSLDFDINLRQLAVLLLKNYLGLPNASPKVRELIRIQKMALDISDEQHALVEVPDFLKIRQDIKFRLALTTENLLPSSLLRKTIDNLFPTPSESIKQLTQSVMGSEELFRVEEVAQVNDAEIMKLSQSLESLNNIPNEDIKNYIEQETIRNSIRHAYRNFFRVKTEIPGPQMTLDDARSEVIKFEREREKIKTSFTPLAKGLYLKAAQKIHQTNNETASGYLLRDNISRREDRWIAIRELQKTAKEALEKERTEKNLELFDRLSAEADALEQRYLLERAFAENIFSLFETAH